MRSEGRTVGVALGFYALWTAATWVFEGRIGTLHRPEATLDRLVYALVVNLLLGIVGAVVLLRRRRPSAGLERSTRRSVVAIVAGALLGLGLYVLQGAPASDPRIVANAYAQVLVVSAAEVLVCWAVLATAVESAALGAGWGRWSAAVLAAVVASLLFGGYHLAHSPPFNRLPMVALLSAVGLLTSAFYLVSRSVLGTIVFHNWLGSFGVVQALAQADALQTFRQWQPPLLATAALTLAVVVAGQLLLARGAATQRPWSPR